MANIARLGDPSSHGGTIISASDTVTADGIGVARTGDYHQCPIRGHGTTPLTGSSSATANGAAIVLVGDTAGCGATITSGSSTAHSP